MHFAFAQGLGMLKHAISPPNTRRKPKALNEAVSLEAQFDLRPTWKQTTAAEARMEMLVPVAKTMEAVPNGSILRPLVGSCMSQTDMTKPMVAVDRSNPPHMASLFARLICPSGTGARRLATGRNYRRPPCERLPRSSWRLGWAASRSARTERQVVMWR